MNPRVALSVDFLEAFSKIPKSNQKKVWEFIERFRENPRSNGINYEKIHRVVDDKVRTVRIGKEYRAIVIHPPTDDVYLCVWVDHHDEAMEWARNKRFDVNPSTGALQVYQVEEARPSAHSQPPGEVVPAGRLLVGRTNEELKRCGVPDALLPAVRSLRSESELDDLAPHLPIGASNALYSLAADLSLDEAVEQANRALEEATKPGKVDVNDFSKALDQPESKQRFKIVDTETELREMLNAPLEKWRIFLHPTQQRLEIMQANGPVCVLGGAGTGKTVVALHRAKHLVRNVFTAPDDMILVTTFTKNLARDLDYLLGMLCIKKEKERIQVTHINSWAAKFLRAQDVEFHYVAAPEQKTLWDKVLGAENLELPAWFYRDEWEKVIQANDVLDKETYWRAKRTGRGISLTRAKRTHVWQVVSRYREELNRRNGFEDADIIREARLFLEREDNKNTLPYRAVIADEVQDLRAADLKLLRALVPPGPNDLFVVGDAHQRIYGHAASLGPCGIDTRGRSRRLRINYRTTKEVRDWAVARLDGVAVDDLNDGKDTLQGYRSLRRGAAPVVRHFRTEAQESEFVVQQVRNWLEKGSDTADAAGTADKGRDICVVARTQDDVEGRYAPMLRNEGIPVVLVRQKSGEDLGEGVRLATMHRVKGLEFKRVLIAGVQEGRVPLLPQGEEALNPVHVAERERGERRLLFVAATRARDELVVCGFGGDSPL